MILQTIYPNGVEVFRDLPHGFNLVKRIADKDFEQISQQVFRPFICEGYPLEHYIKNIYAFIVTRQGKDTYVIFSDQTNYILLDSGQVFMDLSEPRAMN